MCLLKEGSLIKQDDESQESAALATKRFQRIQATEPEMIVLLLLAGKGDDEACDDDGGSEEVRERGR